MDTGLSINDIFLRDLRFNEDDLNFTYNILVKRLKDHKTHIQFITNSNIPSFEIHCKNLKEKFKIYKIGLIKDIPVIFICVDKNNFCGVFYDFQKLKLAFKEYPYLSKLRKEIDLTEHFLILITNLIPKGEALYAYINPNHSLSLKCCKKVFKHVANLYAFKNE